MSKETKNGKDVPPGLRPKPLAQSSRAKRFRRCLLHDFFPTLVILSAVAWIALEISQQLR